MFKSKWTAFNLPLGALEAARSGVSIPSPSSHLGTEGQDLVSLQVPTFQRGLVWTAKHGRDFQKSLERGWPIGEIVLAERDPQMLENGSGQRREFDLIDGQQRTHWLNRTRERFFADALYSLDCSSITDDLETIGSAFRLNGASDVALAYKRWTASDTFTPSRDLEDLNSFLHYLLKEISGSGLAHGSEEERKVQEAIVRLNSEVKTQHTSLLQMGVPVLVIRHTLSENLHEIFQHLNSGTKLSDLDLLAAEWSQIRATITESKSLDSGTQSRIFNFAKDRISETYENDDYTYDPELSELQPDQMSLFDMLYGLGKVAYNNHRDTFANLDDSSDRLALFVASLLFAGSIGSRKQLASYYPDEKDSLMRDVSSFPDQFLRACKAIDSAMTPLNSVRAGKRLKGRLGLIQAATYIASYIANVYWIDTSSGTRMDSRVRASTSERLGPDNKRWTAEKRIDAFKSSLIGWFLHDVLSEEFQGSDAYAAATHRVWGVYDRDASPPTFVPNSCMLGQVSAERLVLLLKERFEVESAVSQTPKQRRYSEATSAILRVAYSRGVANITDEEIDHVIPFDLRRSATFPVPINHPANLMPMKKRLNGQRRNRSIDDFLRDSSVTPDDQHVILERLLIDPENCSLSVLHSPEQFGEFLKQRYRVLGSLALSGTNLIEFTQRGAADELTNDWFLG